MRSQGKSAAFITWDGPQQNYLESLYLPILGRVAERGINFSVLQFAWGEGLRRVSTVRSAAQLGIAYEVHKIFRRPLRPATLAMILIGATRIVAHARTHRTEVLIPRSIIPGAMTLLAHQHLPEVRIVYDSDGFVADERVEFDGWSERGLSYRLFRGVEAQICRVADSVMTRSEMAAHILRRRVGNELDPGDIYIVPNGKEPSLFSPGTKESRSQVRRELGVGEGAPLLLYAGSLGERYLPEHLFRFYAEVRRRRADSFLVVLTGHQELARKIAKKVGLPSSALAIQRVPPETVPSYLAAADLGISLRKETFSQQGVAPIKHAEYLLCGLPIIVTSGVGDVDRQLTRAEGIVLTDVDNRALKEAADQFLERILPNRESFRRRCRQTGLRYFDLENTARGYCDAIERAREDSPMSLINSYPMAVEVEGVREGDPGAKGRYNPAEAAISRYILNTFRL